MEIQKTKNVDARWTVLTIIRIVALFFLIVSVVGFLGPLGIFGSAGHLFSTQQNVAEDQAHGMDAIGGLMIGFIGLMYLGASLLVGIVSSLVIVITSVSLKKKKAVWEVK